jgi:glycosyltransferase involved in cell wall biosynthesis
MRICFYCADQNPERDRSRGITNYTIGLLQALHSVPDVSLSAIVSKSSFPLPVNVPLRRLSFKTDRPIGRLIADQLHPWLVADDAQIWHYPKGFLPLGFQTKALKVGTIADTILQYYADKYPESRSRLNFAYWLQMLRHAIERFDLILTVSEFSQRSIVEFCRRHYIKHPTILVTYEGANIRRNEHRPEKQNYIVHLASRLLHKRTAWLIKQWRRFDTRDMPILRLVGNVDAQLDISDLKNVEVQGAVSDVEYWKLIGSARALLLPSEIEGFGLPALEAYYLGTPVAYVKGTAVEEILGEGTPGGFALEDDSLWDAVAAVLKMEPITIQQKAEDLESRFSWERVAGATIAGYGSLVE